MANLRFLSSMNKYSLLIYGCLLILVGCSKKEGEVFENPPSKETGLTFVNQLTETDDLNILDYLYFYNGGGVAVGDINNDNLPDIFFSGNQVKNKLYLNKGNLRFEDITEKAGVLGNSTWNTGAVMGDVNGDGLLDIYVCAVIGINGFNGHNELYINNGDETFTEKASQYGLDFDTYSSSAAFLDYDLDGDLDIYLLNHAVHTQESFGHADLRLKRNYETGDRLLRNDGDKFSDVSEQAGIYGGVNGYGLGIAVADFNLDGYPDIYVGNDFHEDDYYYLNNGNGTFTESLKQYFGHTTRFSMGNDVADINHDGRPDILSLDMLPEDEKVLKSSEGDDNIQTLKLRTERFGYYYQFTRNMLHLNEADGNFKEVALLAGVAATDWSWSVLFADYNQDGEQDVFISNGIPKRPNDKDYINFVSSEQIKKKLNNTKLVDQKALEMMPSGAVHNYVFKGTNDLKFINESEKWIAKDTLISGATALGDFDNDGDIDLVTNNINHLATLYINKTNEKANYLKIKFNYNLPNKFGIGTKVLAYNAGKLQYKELYTVRGFQASSEPIIHFGFGKTKKIDSLKIIWPNKTYQVLKNVELNQTLEISPNNVKPYKYSTKSNNIKKLFERVDNNLGINFTHVEDNYIDFNRQKLIPYVVSDRGPATAIGDLNNDGKDDIFFGGSKYKPSQVYLQKDTSFVKVDIPEIARDSIKEDVSAIISDMNNDGKNDLYIGSGGADFYNKMKPLLDSYYIQSSAFFKAEKLPEFFENASVVKENDFDNDGDIDLFVAGNIVTNDFGNTPNSYILKNDNGRFSLVSNEYLQKVGMVTDAIWDDFDNDGQKDLVIVGEWMSPIFFKNNRGQLMPMDVLDKKYNGLWQSIIPFDIDNDGDKDYILGNWGTNNKFKASHKYPLKMYYADFDKNGNTETVLAIEKDKKYYPIVNLDDLYGQMVSLKKKFPNYKDFAGKTIDKIFDEEILKEAKILEVNELLSGYLKNENGKFSFVPFNSEMQIAPIMAMIAYDFDKDGKEEVLVAGNYFGVKPYQGRFDSFSGALVKNDNQIIKAEVLGLNLIRKSVRHLNIISINNQDYLLVTLNNDEVQVYKITK